MAPKKNPRSQNRIQTLTFIETDPGSGKNKSKQQLARTQAIRNVFRKRYQVLQDNLENFRYCLNSEEASQDEPESQPLPDPSSPLDTASMDPFQTLAVDASRLTQLLSHKSARQAGEPVFSINEQIDFRLFHDVFEGGMQDPALTHALYLTLKFASNGGRLDDDCLDHRAKAVQHITDRLSKPMDAASSCTIGTILLLVGVEGRLGEQKVANVHLRGVREIVKLCYDQNVLLSATLKRALFWQDLITSLLVGTERVFNHDTFAEIHWHRDALDYAKNTIPQGFLTRSSILNSELLEILGDISVLQSQRSQLLSRPLDKITVLQLDNQQACIESRLHSLSLAETHPLAKVCIYAAYICAYALFTDVWASNRLPAHLTRLLLRHLQAWDECTGWKEDVDLLLWTSSIGAAFADSPQIFRAYGNLWESRGSNRREAVRTMDVESTMADFLWCADVFSSKCRPFWNAISTIEQTRRPDVIENVDHSAEDGEI